MCWSQCTLANYWFSTNTNNNINETTQDKTRTWKRKLDRLRLFTSKRELPKTSVRLQTAFAPETRLAEGQWLEEQLNTVKLRMSRTGTRMPTVSRTERRHLAPLESFSKNKASKWRRLLWNVRRLWCFQYHNDMTNIEKIYCSKGLQILLVWAQVYWSNNSIQFNSCLFTCKLNSTEVNYTVSKST
jgi:hypothetical protein